MPGQAKVHSADPVHRGTTASTLDLFREVQLRFISLSYPSRHVYLPQGEEKMNTFREAVLIALVFLGSGLGWGTDGKIFPASLVAPASAATGEPGREETETLRFMREEEKLARDVYLRSWEQWGHRTFSNISGAEQRHMDTMAAMLERYGIPDPVQDDSVGAFTNPDLGALYERLTERSGKSLLDALCVGRFIEEIDISDLEDAIEESTHGDLASAYERLMNGSYNHLRTYNGQISLLDGEGDAGPEEPEAADITPVLYLLMAN